MDTKEPMDNTEPDKSGFRSGEPLVTPDYSGSEPKIAVDNQEPTIAEQLEAGSNLIVVTTKRNPGGRPTKLTSDLLEKAKGYLATCVDEEWDYKKSSGDKSSSYEFKIRVNLPSIVGFASYLGIARDTVYEWAKQIPIIESGTTEFLIEQDKEIKLHSQFSDILKEVLREQEKRLIEKGLSGDYNPTIAKLILTKHGYHDKVDQDHTSNGESLGVILMPRKDGTRTEDTLEAPTEAGTSPSE